MERPEGSNEMPPGVRPTSPPTTTSESSKPSSSTPAEKSQPKAPEPEEDVKMEDDEEAKAKKEADELKAKGTTAYKARKFEEAAELYQKAWDTWPKDVTYLTNLSGKLFPKSSA